jgi:cysteine desulfurase family protein (TIGR01976 family)
VAATVASPHDVAMTFDVARTRKQFPALEDGTAYFDGPGGTQVPRQVADAVAGTLTSGISNRGAVTAAERRAEDVVAGARDAVADLLGCDPGGVVFARSMTQATYDVSRALAKTWAPGDEVVVTRLDHDANIRPWVQAAEAAGARLRWVGFDRESAELGVDDVRAELSRGTRLVALTGASNVLGTRPDLPAIAEAVHEAGALLYVDGVHLTPHAPVDVAALGADFYACSPYKFFGPHHGVVVAAPDLLGQLHPDKLLPSSEAVPERFELGTLPYELLAGTTAAVDFIAGLAADNEDGEADDGADRRSRVLASMRAVEAHEEHLLERLLDGLRQTSGVTLYGNPGRRTPTAFFSVSGRSNREVYEHLAAAGVNAPASSFYAIEACRWIGLGDGGAVRAGLAPYTSVDDVDRLLAGVAEVAR